MGVELLLEGVKKSGLKRNEERKGTLYALQPDPGELEGERQPTRFSKVTSSSEFVDRCLQSILGELALIGIPVGLQQFPLLMVNQVYAANHEKGYILLQ
eukprot:532910-Pelagomonas_calceolata.AAC.5